MQTKYTYSVSSNTANGKLAADALKEEIVSSAIVTAFDYISRTGDVLDVYMKDELSPGDQLVLDNVIATHEGESLVIPETVEFASKTPLGIPKVAFTKPDGNSKTYTSHNFCDNTTWPATDNSAWSLDSVALQLGKLKVYRAEVQFTHDVLMFTATPKRELLLDILAGGSPVPSEAKIFKSLYDVFDLGNKHYSMNATVDGIPGITTVQFDYTDAIILDPALAMAMRFQLKDDLALMGSHCSVALIAGPVT